jgi:flagellar biosynthesis/type III secretory pathway M-ring protein FliF/YscJ
MISNFIPLFIVTWIVFAIFICIFVMARAQRRQLNRRVQDLLDSVPPAHWDNEEDEEPTQYSNVIRIDPRTGTYRKM